MEKKAESLFKKYKKKYISKLGMQPLDNFQIDTICNNLFGIKYKGSYPVDQKFELKPGYYIINTDLKKGAGVHWVAMVLTKTNAFIYDSFARASNKLISHLAKRLKLAKIKIINSDRKDREQKETQLVCGQLSIAWLAVVKDLGVKSAIKI